MTIWHDVRYSLRVLTKQPVQTLMVVGILAIGIAGAMTIFNLFNGLFLRPLPVPHQERLVDLDETAPKLGRDYTGVSYPHFHLWRQHNKTFECMAMRALWWANLSVDSGAERIHGLKATYDLFEVLGIRPLLGRPFSAEEDRPGGPNVLLLSYGLWERLFAKDATVIGRTLQLDGAPFTIIGVLPPEGAFPEQRDVWLPLRGDPQQAQGIRYGLTAAVGIGRLKEGVTIEQARDDLAGIHRVWFEQHPDSLVTVVTVTDWRERYLGQGRLGMSILLAVAVLLLLIACGNAAGIILTHGVDRSKELATRAALGATHHRIVQHVLSESLVLSVGAGMSGVLLSSYALKALQIRLGDVIPLWMKFGLDIRCASFCLSIIVVATLVCGLLPALHAAFPRDLHATLLALSTRATTSREGRRVLNAIVVTQITLAMTLLIGAALLLQAFRKVQHVNPGFRTRGILTYHIPLTEDLYGQPSKRRAFWAQHLQAVRALPGVVRASLSNNLPMTWQELNHFDIEGVLQAGPGEPDPTVLTRRITPDYFETLEIPLLSGRFLAEHDAQAAIVNRSFAKRFWPGADPLDKRIRLRDSQVWMRVVGMVEDVSDGGLGEPAQPCVHLCADLSASGGMFGVVLTSQDPLSLVRAIREIVRTADSGLPIEQVRTMSQRADQSMLLRRLFTWLFGVPAASAALMAFAGIYAVTSYGVSRRTQEIGIRMALGANVQDVLAMVLRQVLGLVMAGLAIGLIGGALIGHVLASMTQMLYGVRPTDPATFVMIVLLLSIVALSACYLPARRAARTDPMTVLRHE